MTIKVDLLPTERRGFRLDPMVIVLFMLVVLSTVGFAFYGQNLTQQIEAEKKKIEVVKAEIKQNEASRPIIEERRKRLRKLDEQIQIIKNLVHDPQRYGTLLQEVGMCLKSDHHVLRRCRRGFGHPAFGNDLSVDEEFERIEIF